MAFNVYFKVQLIWSQEEREILVGFKVLQKKEIWEEKKKELKFVLEFLFFIFLIIIIVILFWHNIFQCLTRTSISCLHWFCICESYVAFSLRYLNVIKLPCWMHQQWHQIKYISPNIFHLNLSYGDKNKFKYTAINASTS